MLALVSASTLHGLVLPLLFVLGLALSDLFRAQTRDEVLANLLEIAATIGLPVTAWQDGGVARTILTVVAQKIADMSAILALIASGGLLDYATGGWLTLLAKNGYGVDRILSQAGTTTITFTCVGATPNTYQAGEIRVANLVTQKTYKINGPVTLPANGTATVQIIADLTGTASNAQPGEITVMVTTLVGVTCNNATALLGLDEQTDPDLRQLCRDKLAALSPNGPSDAYAYFAKTTKNATGDGYVNVNRVKVSPSSTTGICTVTIAGTTGAVDPADVALVLANIVANCVPTGITPVVQSATNLGLAPAGTVYVSSKIGKLNATIQADINQRFADYLKTVPIGGMQKVSGVGKVFLDALEGQVFLAEVDGNGVSYVADVDLISPGGDVDVSATQVPVYTGVAGNFTINQVVQS